MKQKILILLALFTATASLHAQTVLESAGRYYGHVPGSTYEPFSLEQSFGFVFWYKTEVQGDQALWTLNHGGSALASFIDEQGDGSGIWTPIVLGRPSALRLDNPDDVNTATGEWVQVAYLVDYDAGTGKSSGELFVNGTSVGSAGSAAFSDPTATITLFTGGGKSPFRGDFSDVALYEGGTLTSGDIAALYQAGPVGLPEPPSLSENGLRHFHIGNSHTSGMAETVHELALSRSHADDVFDKTVIGGSILDYTLSTGAGAAAVETLSTEPWERLSMLLYGNRVFPHGETAESDAARMFYQAALAGNPEAIAYLYYDWAGRGAVKKRGLNQDNDGMIQVNQEYVEGVFDPTLIRLMAYFPDKPVYAVPVAQVFNEVARAMEAGEITGFVNIFDFVPDGGHINEEGQYVAGLVHYDSFYREDPRGLTSDFELNNHFTGLRLPLRDGVNADAQDADGEIEFSEEDLAVIQRIVHDAMRSTPRTIHTGHPEDAGMPVAPEDLTATVVNHGQVDLSWTDASDFEKTYIVEVTGPDGTFAEATRTLKDATSVSVAGLESATEYAFRLRAVNMRGEALGAPVNARTLPAVGPFRQAAREDGLIVIEAEDYSRNRLGRDLYRDADWVERADSAASGGSVMQVPADSAGVLTADFDRGALLTYGIGIETAGDYDVWIHAPGKSGSDIWLSVNGGERTEVDHKGWQKGISGLSLGAGTHQVEVLMRKDGFPLDKIIIAPADSGFTPTGLGPQANSFVPPVDGDHNGLIDAWELEQLGSVGTYAGSDNIDGDPYSLLQEMAMDLRPFDPDPALLPLNLYMRDGRRWMSISYRENRIFQQIAIVVEESRDLGDAWTSPGINGVDRLSVVENPDPDGDGSAREMAYFVDVTEEDHFFLRLRFQMLPH